jgi:branched-chain amino acid transport system substrate-binding protein
MRATRYAPGVWPALLLVFSLALAGCDKPMVVIGFVGGLTGHAADLGIAGRDGALLAVEQTNQQGGILEAQVRLLEFDDRQQPDSVVPLMQAVQNAGVVAVVGPMTSSVAKNWIPLANQARLLTISPTVTSSDFSGHDDYFFRVISDATDYARSSALSYAADSRWQRFAVLFDETNAAYTRNWVHNFRRGMQQFGAEPVAEIGFGLPDSPTLPMAVQKVLAKKPTAVVLVANAADTARLASLLRHRQPLLQLAGAEWSATEQLLALGGIAVEGMRIVQFMDHQDQSASYLRFVAEFQTRYRRAPGFAEVAAYDATRVLLQVMRQRQAQESLKDCLLRVQQFAGLQQPVIFDGSGDSGRRAVPSVVHNRRFETLAQP